MLFSPGRRWRPLLLLTLLLAGCASTPPARLANGQPLDRYTLEARFALRENGKAYQGRLHWQHSRDTDAILVKDPFGGGVAELNAREGSAHMIMADGQRHEADDSTALMASLTGVPLPIRRVARWLIGREAPAGESQRDVLGRITAITTQGWKVNYEYEEATTPDARDALPLRVTAANGEGIELRLAIESWTLNENGNP